MKHKSILLVAALTMLMACSEKTKTTSNTSTQNPLPAPDCNLYPWAIGCPGSTTSGSTTGGGVTPPGNYNPIPTAPPSDNNWQALYPSGEPTGSCSDPTGSGYELRKGTITMAGGGTWYLPGGDTMYAQRTGRQAPAAPMEAFSNNISSYLMTPQQAKLFYETDSKLRVRFKVRPQYLPTAGTGCYNRISGAQDYWGYTKLKFSVSYIGLNQDGSLKTQNGFPVLQFADAVQAGVNSCTKTIDLQGAHMQHEHGIVLVIHDIQSDQACSYQSGCTGWTMLRQQSCMQLDIEVSADGHKDI